MRNSKNLELEKNIPDIKKYVLELLTQIPKGKVTTYKELAIALGDEIATRAVGNILSENRFVNKYPCYKVVHSNGEVGNYILGKDEKIRRLIKEGIEVKNGKIINIDKYLFKNFSTDYPLKKLREKEEKIKKLIKEQKVKEFEIVAGVDVSYRQDLAKCCYIAMNKDFEILEKKVLFTKANFPYIPTYFYYREGPIILEILDRVKIPPNILLIDGNGLLHPRGLGIATLIGIKTNLPTIGVVKSLLFGKVRGNDILVNNKVKGKVVKLKSKKIYVSVGNNIDLNTSVKIVKRFSIYEYPEPLRLAHKYSRFSN